MGDVILFDREGFLHTFVEKKQGIINISGFNRFGYEGKMLFSRKVNEINVDCDYLSDLLNAFKNKMISKEREVKLILPQGLSWYQALNVEEVPKNKNEVYEFVMWKIQKLIPIPKEQVEMSIDIISKAKEGSTILIAVTFKTFIMEVERCFRKNNIKLPLIIPPTIAFLNAIESYLTESSYILWLREKGFSMISFVNGIPRFIREIDQELPLERVESEIFSFMTVVSNNIENDKNPERLVYFDELMRQDIKKYLPENSIAISPDNMKLSKSINLENFGRYIVAAGVLL